MNNKENTDIIHVGFVNKDGKTWDIRPLTKAQWYEMIDVQLKKKRGTP